MQPASDPFVGEPGVLELSTGNSSELAGCQLNRQLNCELLSWRGSDSHLGSHVTSVAEPVSPINARMCQITVNARAHRPRG